MTRMILPIVRLRPLAIVRGEPGTSAPLATASGPAAPVFAYLEYIPITRSMARTHTGQKECGLRVNMMQSVAGR